MDVTDTEFNRFFIKALKDPAVRRELTEMIRKEQKDFDQRNGISRLGR